MSKDRLIVTDTPQGFAIGWWLAAEQGVGALLGDREFDEADLQSDSPLTFEAAAAHFECSEAAQATGATKRRAGAPWIWDSKSEAQRALILIKTGVVARRKSRPMPEWARTAMANGWKPPKGWTP